MDRDRPRGCEDEQLKGVIVVLVGEPSERIARMVGEGAKKMIKTGEVEKVKG